MASYAHDVVEYDLNTYTANANITGPAFHRCKQRLDSYIHRLERKRRSNWRRNHTSQYTVTQLNPKIDFPEV